MNIANNTLRTSIYILWAAMLLAASPANGQEYTVSESYQSPLYNKIEHILLSPDKNTLIASDSAGYVLFWGRDGSIRKILRAHMQPVTNINVSPNGAYMATTSRDNQIIVWDFLTGEKISYSSTAAEVFSLAFSNDGSSLYYAAPNGLYKTSFKESGFRKVYDSKISDADGSNDSRFFAIGNQSEISLLSLLDSSLLYKTSSCSGTKRIELRGNLICSLCEDGSIQLFELKGKTINEIKSSKSEMTLANSMLITDDKQVLLAHSGKSILWNFKTNRFYSLPELSESVTAIGYGEGGVFYIGNNKGKISPWKPIAGEEIKSLHQAAEKKSNTEIEIETTTSGIPSSLGGRSVRAQQPVEVNSPTLDIYVWDDEHEDGDTISLNLNGEWILQNYMITGEKKKLTIDLVPGKINYLILYAHNLGTFPPNTAVVSFQDGKTEKRLTVESDLKRCGAVTFTLKK